MLVLYLFESMSNIRYFGLDILPLQGGYKLYPHSNLTLDVEILHLLNHFSCFRHFHLLNHVQVVQGFLYLIYLLDIL